MTIGFVMIAFELYGAGLTTQQVGGVFEKLYGRHYSKSSVSRMFDYAREEVLNWLERPLDNYYPIIYVDALFWSTRRDGCVSKEVYYTLLGVKCDRTREVLGIVNFPTESASSWEEVFRGLKNRGVENIGLLVADGLNGLETAAARTFVGTPFQKCVVHLERNVLGRIKPSDRKAVGAALKEVFLTIIMKEIVLNSQQYFKKLVLIVMLIAITTSNFAQQKSIILGRPTNNSITASILFDQNVNYYLEYGTSTGVYTNSSPVYTNTSNVPDEIDLTNLLSNTKYFYRVQYKTMASSNYTAAAEYSFQTQRAVGSNFVFTVEADEHLYDHKGDATMYQITLANQAADHPDFMLSLGDTFGDDHTPLTTTDAVYPRLS